MNSINNAAALIAYFDPQLAEMFIRQPFQRHNIVTGFHRSLSNSKHAAMADRVAVALRSAIDSAS